MFKFIIATVLFPLFVLATATISFSYENQEITKMIQDYAKASGKTFIVDPGVRGKISIYQADKVSLDVAYELLSSALAVNGYAISIQNGTYLVKSARNIQRDLIEVTTQLPSLKPERMVSYVISFKHASSESILRNLRILPSKDGEMVSIPETNQLIVTDWTSNLHRIDKTLKELDRPVDAATKAIVKSAAVNEKQMNSKNLSKSKKLKMEKSDFENPEQ